MLVQEESGFDQLQLGNHRFSVYISYGVDTPVENRTGAATQSLLADKDILGQHFLRFSHLFIVAGKAR